MFKKSDCVLEAKEILSKKNISDIDNSIRFIMEKVSEKKFDIIKTLSDEEHKEFIKLIKLRHKHVPLDKIMEFTNFYNIKIPFNKNVLTPRQETELLADRIIKDIKLIYKQINLKNEFQPISVLDLCTGSGCIGLAIANSTNAIVTMSDKSRRVIKIAKENARLNNIERTNMSLPPVEPNFVVSDLFDKIDYKFDIIVCNPPYIKTHDLKKLEIEVRDFDPKLALDGGKDGLKFYRKVINDAHKYLNENGRLYLEIGINQCEDIVKMLEKNFDNIEVMKDYAKIDRFIIAKKRENNA